ncbi:MAG: M15 family metallopeptidase [Candidatus Gracilibacteria bacterium]|nr:M15 family metallopeptidase [Candidatus Gracilibacteria bacterium]
MEQIYKGLDKLNPRFKEKVELFLKDVGDKIIITESWRSQERQNYLYSLGRTTPGKTVTWTKDSEHTKGLAIDIAFNGKELYPNDIYLWKEISEIAKKYQIDWGYDLWKTDKPHFQDNGKELVEENSIFLKDSKFAGFIKDDLDKGFKFNDYLDDRPSTIADVKELITLYDQRK